MCNAGMDRGLSVMRTAIPTSVPSPGTASMGTVRTSACPDQSVWEARVCRNECGLVSLRASRPARVLLHSRALLCSQHLVCLLAGTFHWSNGDKYEGEWAGDVMEGRGKVQYANGNVYSGYLRNNIKQGSGSSIPCPTTVVPAYCAPAIECACSRGVRLLGSST